MLMHWVPICRFHGLNGVDVAAYPPIKAGQQVLNELKAIGMADELASA